MVSRVLSDEKHRPLGRRASRTVDRRVAPRLVPPAWSGYGSLGTAGALPVDLSVLSKTQGVADPNASDGGFLAKDLTLFGAAL